jgi:hypothetical protein
MSEMQQQECMWFLQFNYTARKDAVSTHWGAIKQVVDLNYMASFFSMKSFIVFTYALAPFMDDFYKIYSDAFAIENNGMPILLSLNAPIKIRVIYCTVYLIFC